MIKEKCIYSEEAFAYFVLVTNKETGNILPVDWVRTSKHEAEMIAKRTIKHSERDKFIVEVKELYVSPQVNVDVVEEIFQKYEKSELNYCDCGDSLSKGARRFKDMLLKRLEQK